MLRFSRQKCVCSVWRDCCVLYDPISHEMHVVQQFNMVLPLNWLKTYPKKTTVSPGGNKPMCVFYHTCVVKTQHLPVCYFHICVVISTHMCERAHMCGKNHTSCPRVVCGVYHTCVGKTFVLSFFETFPSHFFCMTPKNVCMGRCVVAIIAFV